MAGWTWLVRDYPEVTAGESDPRSFVRLYIPMVSFTLVVLGGVAYAWAGVTPWWAVGLGVVLFGTHAGNVYGRAAERAPIAFTTFQVVAIFVAIAAMPLLATRSSPLLWGLFLLYAVICGANAFPSVLVTGMTLSFPIVVPALRGALTSSDQWIEAMGIAGIATSVYLGRAISAAQRQGERARDRARLASAAAEEERKRISRELHDTMGSTLSELRLWLDLARQSPASLDERGRDALARAHERSGLALTELRALVQTMDAQRIDIDVARRLLEERVAGLCAAAGVGLHIVIERDGEAGVSHDLVKLVEEAVLNAIKHGKPRRIEVSLRGGDAWRAEIVDDGVGFDVAVELERDRLRAIRARADALHGKLDVTSRAGRTRVVAEPG